MSRIDDLMTRFADVRGSSIGRGPLHPTSPDPGPGPRIARFLDTYPRLRRDAGYVEFLQKYAGASIENEDLSQIVDILGFSDASTDMEELDGPVVDRNGFLMIGEAVYHLRDGIRNVGTLEHAFAYQVADEQARGLFHSLVSEKHPTPAFSFAFPSFENWLEDLIARDGWLEPPGHP
ncbi:hypothetical protein [Kocuria rhizosphaericola]|uniref:hypothetical protein n=1 Tax=Kocuria rhizosphaericola TaxID=3376284 RepID=UPI0037898A9F